MAAGRFSSSLFNARENTAIACELLRIACQILAYRASYEGRRTALTLSSEGVLVEKGRTEFKPVEDVNGIRYITVKEDREL